MYQAIVGWLLGIKREGNTIVIEPSVPAGFGDYTVKYSHGASVYIIEVPNPKANDYVVEGISVDGKEIKANSFKLTDDKKRHYVHVNISKS
jgi:cellobiose phosphorylase